MATAKKQLENNELRALIPLDSLSDTNFSQIVGQTAIQEIRAGQFLFRAGDSDGQFIYLLRGELQLLAGKELVETLVETLVGGSDAARYPIAPKQPRHVSAKAKTRILIARVNTSLLDVLTHTETVGTYEVEAIGSSDNEDWIARLLLTEVFQCLPFTNTQQVLTRIKPVDTQAGEVIIHQGDEGEYFYIIKKGRCLVSRKSSPDAEAENLAELGDGDSFGEESLLSDARRNASVTMITDGCLMRLSKQDFVELFQGSLVSRVVYEKALALVKAGAIWLDVRFAEEFSHNALPDSINLPLFQLRDRAAELSSSDDYILCCTDGRQSANAAFLLSRLGLSVRVLEGGLQRIKDVGLQPHNGGESDLKQGEQTADDLYLDTENETAVQIAQAETAAMHAKLRAVRSSHESTMQVLQQRVASLEQALEQVETEKQLIAKGQKDKQTQHGLIEQRLEQACSEATEYGKRLEETRQSLSQAQEESQNLLQQLKDLQENQDVLDKRRLAEQEHLQQQLKTTQAQSDTELADLRAETDSSIVCHEAAEQEAHGRIQALEASLQGAEEHEQELTQLLAETQREGQAFQEELEALQEKSCSAEQDWQTQIITLEEQLAESGKAQQTLEEQLETAGSQCRELEQARGQAQADAKRQTESLQQFHQQLSATESNTEQEVLVLNEQLQNMQQRLETANIERDGARTRLADFAASTRELEAQNLEQQTNWQLEREQFDKLQQQLETDGELLAKERDSAIEKLNQQVEETTRLSRRVSGLEAEGKGEFLDLREQCEAAEKRVHMEVEKRERQTQECRSLKAELSVRREQEALLRKEVDTIQKREAQVTARLREQLEKQRRDTGCAEIKAEQLGNVVNQIAVPVADLPQQEAAQAGLAEEQRDLLNGQLKKLQQELEVARADLADVGEQFHIREQALGEELDEARLEAERNLKESHRELEEARAQLEQAVEARQENGKPTTVDSEEESPDPLFETELDKATKTARPPRELFKTLLAKLNPLLAITQTGTFLRKLFTKGKVAMAASLSVIALVAVYLIISPADNIGEKVLQPALQSIQPESASAIEQAAGKTPVADDGPNGVRVADIKKDQSEGGQQSELKSMLSAAFAKISDLQETLSKQKPSVEAAATPVSDAAESEAKDEKENQLVEKHAVLPAKAVSRGREFRDQLQAGRAGPVMLELSAGQFAMGSKGSSPNFDERPQHLVKVSRFAMSKYEVTFSQYDRFAGSAGRPRPNDQGWGRGNQPVINISWKDAVAYTQWLSKQTGHRYRLASEAEWEYAARAGTQSLYWWGVGKPTANCFDCGSKWGGAKTAPVGRFKANGFGLHDIAGNVAEWVQDCHHQSYKNAPGNGSAWDQPSCDARVVRGGSYASPKISVRSAKRTRRPAYLRLDTVGFRVVREL